MQSGGSAYSESIFGQAIAVYGAGHASLATEQQITFDMESPVAFAWIAPCTIGRTPRGLSELGDRSVRGFSGGAAQGHLGVQQEAQVEDAGQDHEEDREDQRELDQRLAAGTPLAGTGPFCSRHTSTPLHRPFREPCRIDAAVQPRNEGTRRPIVLWWCRGRSGPQGSWAARDGHPAQTALPRPVRGTSRDVGPFSLPTSTNCSGFGGSRYLCLCYLRPCVCNQPPVLSVVRRGLPHGLTEDGGPGPVLEDQARPERSRHRTHQAAFSSRSGRTNPSRSASPCRRMVSRAAGVAIPGSLDHQQGNASKVRRRDRDAMGMRGFQGWKVQLGEGLG